MSDLNEKDTENIVSNKDNPLEEEQKNHVSSSNIVLNSMEFLDEDEIIEENNTEAEQLEENNSDADQVEENNADAGQLKNSNEEYQLEENISDEDFQYNEVPEEEFEVVNKGIQAQNDKAEVKAFVEKEMQEIVTNQKVVAEVSEEKSVEPEQKQREKRKNRRIRAQVVCYVVIMAVLVVSGVGIAWGFETWTENNRQAKKIAMANKEEQMNAFVELTESEEELIAPGSEENPSSEASSGDIQVVVADPEIEGGEVTPETETQPSEEVKPQEENTVAYAITPVEKTAKDQELNEKIDQMIAEMSLEDKVAGLFIITPEALTKNNTVTKAAGGTKSALTKYPVGGLIYAKKNITAAAQVTTMLKNTAEYATYPLFLAVSEEGGNNGPLANAKAVEKTSTAKEMGEAGDVQSAFNAGNLRGEAMAKVGMNLNMLSIGNLSNVENSMMDEYSFGADAETVIPYVQQMIAGLSAQGVNVCIGQFPGNGGVSVSEEGGTKINARSLEELQSQEFMVFKAAVEAGADMISVGTIAVPAITGDNIPAVLSPSVVTDLLRNEMGYQGIIITDAMNMPEITEYYGADEAAVLALRAGCDMIYLPEKFDVAYNGVLSAVEEGTIDENRINDALRRIYRVKYAELLTSEENQ